MDLARADGQCLEITATGWKVLPQPPGGVIFTRSTRSKPLPLPAPDGDLSALSDVLALPQDSAEFRLMLGWALTLPFRANAQPALLLVGAPGHGKSTRLRLAVSLWEPSDEYSLGSSFGRDAEDDIVRARHRAVPIWDNLSSVSGATSDHFCTMVTGTGIENRKLHTNGDLYSQGIARPIGLTAVGLPAGFRPDALDRLIVVELLEIVQRVSDAEVQAAFDRAHPQLLGAACGALSAALAHRRVGRDLLAAWFADRRAPRMLGHAELLAALDRATTAGNLPGCPTGLLAAFDNAQRDFRQRIAADDAFGGPLLALLRSEPRREVEPGIWEATWQGKANTLRSSILAQSAMTVGTHFDTSTPGWPKSDRQVPTCLSNLAGALRELGITYETKRGRGYTRYHLTLRGGAELWES